MNIRINDCACIYNIHIYICTCTCKGTGVYIYMYWCIFKKLSIWSICTVHVTCIYTRPGSWPWRHAYTHTFMYVPRYKNTRTCTLTQASQRINTCSAHHFASRWSICSYPHTRTRTHTHTHARIQPTSTSCSWLFKDAHTRTHHTLSKTRTHRHTPSRSSVEAKHAFPSSMMHVEGNVGQNFWEVPWADAAP